MRTPETIELMRKYLRPSGELGNLLREGAEWNKTHPVAARRAFDLINTLPTQPEERQRRIAGLVERLYSRR